MASHNSWCPVCAKNNNVHENLFRKAIENVASAEFPTVTPDWLRNESGYQLEIDGFNEKLMISFEYQGRQHFEFVELFHLAIKSARTEPPGDNVDHGIKRSLGSSLL